VFFLPRGLLATLARARWLRRSLAFLLRPVVAITSWVVILVAWHLPVLYEAALERPLVHRFEHLSFVVVGLLVWALIVDPSRHRRLTVGERIGVVTVVFFAGQILSYVMVFSTAPFYSTYADAPHRLLGLSALTDQKLAGVVMMVEQALTLGIAFALLVRLGRDTAAPHDVQPGHELPARGG
jgi:cytochrome c oxidase assembly factor CtaG